MSFDIFFQPCRFGGKKVKKKNPFTGKVQESLPNEPLSDAEVKAVTKVVKKASADDPSEHGCYFVSFKDGGRAEVYGDNLSESCMVANRGQLTADLMEFLFDLLEAGKWAMLPAMEDSVAITCSAQYLTGLPEDFPEVVECRSAQELSVLLSKGFRVWKKYRDQVVGGKE